MTRPVDIGAVDTLIGFRSARNAFEVPSLRDSDRGERHPAEYMYKQVPAAHPADADPLDAIAETVEKMDTHHIDVGVISLSDPRTPNALGRYPDRFVAVLPVDGNDGMDAVRAVTRAVEEHDVRGVSLFPAGTMPQLPIDDKHWYPIYAKCVELDLAVFVATGVPGPRVPLRTQHVELIDEVCFDFPELKVVMRHGGEPWTDLAVKLLLKWPNLFYSTSGFAPKHYPQAIIDFANTRGADKVIYAGYYPYGIELERTFAELDGVPFRAHVWTPFLRDNARRILRLDPVAATAAVLNQTLPR